MYSFGIICQEIMYRKGVYWLGPEHEDSNYSRPTNILKRMFNKTSSKTDWQPFVDDIDTHYILEDADDFFVAPDLRSMVQVKYS